MITETGSHGKLSEDTTHFVDYFVIKPSLTNHTTYFIYQYHQKSLLGLQESSNFWENFPSITEREKNLIIKDNASTSEIDTIIFNNFSYYGAIQVIEKTADESLRFQLKDNGFIFTQNVKRIPTTEDPLESKNLIQNGCVIL